ncbi:KAP family P-loop NTPase fold protein [Roseovarius sp.]|jgi:hypothetical protein
MSGKKFERFVGPDDTFADKDKDLLDRKHLADALTNLVTTSQDSMILALDDEWGAGKTYFLKLWENHLKKQNKPIPVVYFNAFENDLAPDAFVALSAHLVEVLGASEKNKEVKDILIGKAARLAKVIGRSALNIGIKAATGGVIQASDADGTLEAAIQQTGKEIMSALEQQIRDRAGYKAQVKEFASALEDVRTALQQKDSDLPLVFIVDELDRCRPNFALDVLECLKHFFGIEKCHFVLGVNMNALAGSVEAIYGQSINGNAYLSRFIDYRISFSVLDSKSSQEQLEKFARTRWRTGGAFENHSKIKENMLGVISAVSAARNGKPRDIDKIMSILHLCLGSISDTTQRTPALVGGLILMKHYEPWLFAKALSGNLKFADVESFFHFKANLEDYEQNGSFEIEHLHKIWAACLDGPINEDLKLEIRSSWATYGSHSDSTLVQDMARHVVDRFWQG